MGMVLTLQRRLQLAPPSTQLIAGAWLAGCLTHAGPGHQALQGSGQVEGGEEGRTEMGVWLSVLPSRPLSPLPTPQLLSRVSAVPTGAGAGLSNVNRGQGRLRGLQGSRARDEVALGQGENVEERPGERGWGRGEGREGETGWRRGVMLRNGRAEIPQQRARTPGPRRVPNLRGEGGGGAGGGAGTRVGPGRVAGRRGWRELVERRPSRQRRRKRGREKGL